MLFCTSIDVPASTSKETPYSVPLKITAGTIRQWIVIIPVATGWTCGLQVYHRDFQLLPLTVGEWVEGGLVRVQLDEEIEISEPPYFLEIRCFNEDSNFSHKIWFGVSILRKTNLVEMLGSL